MELQLKLYEYNYKDEDNCRTTLNDKIIKFHLKNLDK